MIDAFYLLDTGYCRASEASLIRGGARKTVNCHALIALLHHTREGWLLFDTGYGPRLRPATARLPYRLYRGALPAYSRPEQSAAAQLARFGLTANDISQIIVSHFHPDHIAGIGDFPKARFICDRTAWEHVSNKNGIAALRRGLLPDLIPTDFAARTCFIEDYSGPNLFDLPLSRLFVAPTPQPPPSQAKEGEQEEHGARGLPSLTRNRFPILLPLLRLRGRGLGGGCNKRVSSRRSVSTELGLTHDLFSDGTLLLVPLPGHARGQIGLFAPATPHGSVFLIADAAYVTRSLRDNVPPGAITNFFAEDSRAVAGTIARLDAFRKQHPEVIILPTHCPEAFARVAEWGGPQ